MKKNTIKLKNMFFASCPTGLEELLASEIKQLDYEKIKVVKGGVHIEAPAKVALELMLSSRIASRIYKKLYTFEFNSEKELYQKAYDIKWKSIFNIDQSFKISVIQGKSENGEKRSKFKSSIFLAQNLKDAIVDRFRKDSKGERPSVDKESPEVSFLMRVEPTNEDTAGREIATILLDMTGAPLSHRGYRDTNFSAPLKENLAAGLVMLSGYKGAENFVDPMCGSGTIVIESLLIKGDIPPSYLAIEDMLKYEDEIYWDFMNHNWFFKDKYLQAEWKDLIRTYKDKTKKGFKKLRETEFKTIARDNQKYALNAIGFNLKAANLNEFVDVDFSDATLYIPSVDKGIIITNPPYGERIGKDDNLPELYYKFGENLKKNFKNFKAYIFTGNLPLLKKISLRTSRKDILWNGNIESRLAEYKLY